MTTYRNEDDIPVGGVVPNAPHTGDTTVGGVVPNAPHTGDTDRWLFGDLSGSVDTYTYNARSELTSARRTKNGQPISGFSEDFDYDPIGNRRSSATYNEKHEKGACPHRGLLERGPLCGVCACYDQEAFVIDKHFW